MPTDYDTIAEQYRQAKRQPWRSRIESFTLLELTGELAGLSVVDLACGEGFYTRKIRQGGAARVLGVDLSEGMIALADEQERLDPQGIAYRVGDCRDLDLDGQFDLALAAYLLNYARTRAELAAMCRSVAACLKPSGRFVTVNSNPELGEGPVPSFRPYGFEVEVPGELAEGARVLWRFDLEDGPLEVENYHLDRAAHEEALREAGFGDVRWHRPRLAPIGEAEEGRTFWEPFLQAAPVIFLECRKEA